MTANRPRARIRRTRAPRTVAIPAALRHIAASIALAALAAAASAQPARRTIDLAGTWRFDSDREDAGLAERWFLRTLGGTIRLPGSMAENGLGEDVGPETAWTGQIVDRSWFTAPEYAKFRLPGSAKLPFWLTPLRHYAGAAWYQRDVVIPTDWAGARIVLSLERCHWLTRLWVDGREAGSRDSLGTPHEYDLSDRLPPGRHTLTLLVDNRIKDIDVGENAHSVSDHTQTNWNGIVGRMTLLASPPVHLEDVRVFPDAEARTVRVEAVVRNRTGWPQRGTMTLTAIPDGGGGPAPRPLRKRLTIQGSEERIEAVYALGPGARLWDEFAPSLYALEVRLTAGPGERYADSASVRFGLRRFEARGTRFWINGRPVFLRGTLECCIFPRTGYPAMDEAEWRRIFSVCKAHGLNHVRFHSWCPPEAAFAAADEAGIYLYVECGAWTDVGDGAPIDAWIFDESERIVRAYGNHPSFCMMSYGNEPGGKNQAAFLSRFVSHWKARDPRRLYTGAAGWPRLPESDFHVLPEPRIQRWGEGLNSILNRDPPQSRFDFRDIVGPLGKPVVGHEVGQWCAYPNLTEIYKYTGVLRARNFEIFRETLVAAGMGPLAADFLTASGKLQALCYKADIEAALRTPGYAGFELLDLHDFPGQGTATVGVLDPFWEEKGAVSPAEFRRFCGETVPLVRMPAFVFTSNESLRAEIEAAHFGPAPLAGVALDWAIADAAGRRLFDGGRSRVDVGWGNAVPLDRIDLPLATFPAPGRFRLTVRLGAFENGWDFWVYPAEPPEIEGREVRVVRRLDDETAIFLESGGRVILTPEKGLVRPEKGGSVAVGFSSIFWNTAWTSKQPPHTLGILCDPAHPALAAFPTEAWSGWEWWDAMRHGQAILLSDFGPGLTPIVRLIDDWFTNRPLGLVFEVGVGRGGLIVSGVDLLTDDENRPAARQLLHSLAAYAAGPSFRPARETSVAAIQRLFRDEER